MPTAVKMAWASCLDVLSEIDRICTKRGITYFADWGSLLGAVRHGGFVPWDDDLDICMKRDDYVRFREVADAELPSHYDIHDYARHEDHWMFLARVVNNKRMNFDPAYMTEHYNFPYLAGVDIFIKDYLYEDEEDEKRRDAEIMNILAVAEGIIGDSMSDGVLKKCLDDISSKYGITFPEKARSRETAVELYKLAEKLMSEVDPKDTEHIGQIYPFILKGITGRREDKRSYDNIIRIPFEDTSIPVPAEYGKMLSLRYGSYFTVHKVWSGHTYPFYESQKAEMERLLGRSLPSFAFDGSMLERPKAQIDDALKTLTSECMEELKRRLDVILSVPLPDGTGPSEEDIREFIQLSSDLIMLIEQVKGEDNAAASCAVSELHKFNEKMTVLLGMTSESFETVKYSLEAAFSDTCDSVKKRVLDRREVLFVLTGPDRLSSILKYYKKECLRDDTDIYVVPVPYLIKDPLGNVISDEEEAASLLPYDEYLKFVKREHLCEYYMYEPSLHCPDEIYIQDPYDGENPLLTIPPQYYAENLRRYTDRLIFVQFGKTADFGPEDVTDQVNMKHYVTSPGVVYSDEVYIYSKKIKEQYVNCLIKFAGEETKKIWEERIKVTDMSENSEEKKSKKRIMYCIGANEMFEYGEKVTDALLDRFKTFLDASDGINVGVTLFPDDRKEWTNANSRIASKVFKVIDDAASKDNVEVVSFEGQTYEEAAAGYDAYYGSPSPYVLMFTQAKKPAMLSDYSISSND